MREVEISVRCVIDGARSVVPYTNRFNEKMQEALKNDLTLFYPRITAAFLIEPAAEGED